MSYKIRIFCHRLMVKNSSVLKKHTEGDTNCSLVRKPFIEYSRLTATPQIVIYDSKIFCIYFQVMFTEMPLC